MKSDMGTCKALYILSSGGLLKGTWEKKVGKTFYLNFTFLVGINLGHTASQGK